MRRTLALFGLLLALLAPSIAPAADASGGAWQPLPYRLGQGLYFPQQGLRVGGYASLHFDALRNQPSSLSIQDLSLFLTKSLGARWNLFTEMEVGDALTLGHRHLRYQDADFDIERLYADYHARPGITLRLGKFLTPVGQWNLIHADPLVPTVSRPLTTTAAFARHATGAMLYGVVPAAGHDLDYWLFADDTEALDPSRRRELAYNTDGAQSVLENRFKWATGARLQYHLLAHRLSIGASYLRFSMQAPEAYYHLTGLDFSWHEHYATLSGEGIYRSSDSNGGQREYGGFLQALVPLNRRLDLIFRHERYQSSILPNPTRLNTIGLDYRPLPALSLKFEYRGGSGNALVAPDGWLGSIAVLF